jgi:hypothetical protein
VNPEGIRREELTPGCNNDNQASAKEHQSGQDHHDSGVPHLLGTEILTHVPYFRRTRRLCLTLSALSDAP